MTVKEFGNEIFQWFTMGAEHLFSGAFSELSVGQIVFTIAFAVASILMALSDYEPRHKYEGIGTMGKVSNGMNGKKRFN